MEETTSEAIHSARSRLIGILEQRLDATLERIFRLLGLRYPPEDIIPVYDGIRNTSNDIRTNSVEFLDNLLEPRLKKILIPVAETAMMDGISQEAIRNLNVIVPDEAWCLRRLLEGKDPNLKAAVFNLIQQLGNPGYAELVQPFVTCPIKRVREAAEKTLETLLVQKS